MAYKEFVPAGIGKKAVLLDAVAAPVTSNNGLMSSDNWTIQGTVQGTGAITATINIEYSNDGIAWMPGPQIVLTGSTLVTDGFFGSEHWIMCKATLASVTGTGAAVTVTLAV